MKTKTLEITIEQAEELLKTTPSLTEVIYNNFPELKPKPIVPNSWYDLERIERYYINRYSDIKYDIGDSVYLKTDPEQAERLITGISVRQNGITYAISHLTNETWHYDFEITKDRDIIKATSS